MGSRERAKLAEERSEFSESGGRPCLLNMVSAIHFKDQDRVGFEANLIRSARLS